MNSETIWDLWADCYDLDDIGLAPEEAALTLAELAGTGKALELGVGTGRVAVPLAKRGVPVTGVDTSSRMLARLDERAAGMVHAVQADMSQHDLSGFRLVYCVTSTLWQLTTQTQQIACLTHAAKALDPSGLLVLETGIPGPSLDIGAGRQLRVREVGQSHAKVSIMTVDPYTQVIRTQELRWTHDGRAAMLPMVQRYVHLSELDLMARLAGLRLVSRSPGWDTTTRLRAGDRRAVSVYQHP